VLDADRIQFDPSAMVVPRDDLARASRLVVRLPAFGGQELRYPDRYPDDMRQAASDGASAARVAPHPAPHPLAGAIHPKAGRPLEDWQGQPVLCRDGSVPRGVVFFNYEDARYQGARGDGRGVIIFNRPTPEAAADLARWIEVNGGAAGALADVTAIVRMLDYAQKIGLDDRYESDADYVEQWLMRADEPLIPGAALAPDPPRPTCAGACGLYVRRAVAVPAVFVTGPAQVGDAPIGPEGAVFLRANASPGALPKAPSFELRKVSLSAFAQTYVGIDGLPVDVSKLPRIDTACA